MALTVNADSDLTAWESVATDSVAMPTSTATVTFNVETGKSFLATDTAMAIATAAAIPTGIMGTISSYNSGTGALVIAPTNAIPTNQIACGVMGRIWSKSSVANGTGSKTFGISGEPWHLAGLTVGLTIRVHSRTAPFTNFMTGTVTSLTNGTLVVNVTSATGTATVADWIICQSGTFSAWTIAPQCGDTWNGNGNATLTVSQTAKAAPRFINALTRGRVLIKNTSTTTPLHFRMRHAVGTNTGSDLRFEQNAVWKIEGDWIPLGTGTGLAAQSLALPSGWPEMPLGIEVETAAGSGVFRQWIILPLDYGPAGMPAHIIPKTYPVAHVPVGNILWYKQADNTVECGDGTNGSVIPSGAIVRIPNITINADEFAPCVVQTTPQDSTSSSSVAHGTGAKTFTVGTGLSYVATNAVRFERVGDPTVSLIGTVTSYNSGTGVMVVNIATAAGAGGTYDDWKLLDARNITISDSSYDNSTQATTNWSMLVAGERVTGTRTGNVVASVARNVYRARGHGGTWGTGSAGYTAFTTSASGSGPGYIMCRIDLGPSGTLDASVCSFGPRIGWQGTDLGLIKLRNVGISQYFLQANSQGSVDFQDVILTHLNASQPGINGSLTLGLTGFLGAVTLRRVTEYTIGANIGNAALTNIPSLTEEGCAWLSFDRAGGFPAVIHTACTFASTPVDNYFIGQRVSFASMSDFEFGRSYHAADPDGTVYAKGSGSATHISIATCNNFIVRDIRPIGDMKLLANASLISSDTLSSGGIFHDADFSAENNATSTTSVCVSGGGQYIYANMDFGTVPAAFADNQNRGNSLILEKDVTYRNIRCATAGSQASNAGAGYSTGLRMDFVTMGQMRYSSNGVTVNPSYNDCANFYVLVDPSATAGRLVVGAVSGEASADVWELTGTAYINNDGRVYLEGDGDSIIVKNRFPLRGITAFQNIAPTIRAINGGALGYEFRACQWGEDITAESWATLDAAGLSAFVVDDSDVGLDMQVRITGTGAVAGRFFEQLLIATDNDATYDPPPSETIIRQVGAEAGAAGAIIALPETIIASGAIPISGTLALRVPFFADGVTLTRYSRVRKYGYSQSAVPFSYYRASVDLSSEQSALPAITQPSGTAAAHTGISVTDHAGSPVTWEGEQFGISVTCDTTVNPTLSFVDVMHYLHYWISQSGAFAGKASGLLWHNMLPPGGAETVRGDYGSAGFKGVRVVDQDGDAFPGVLAMQADDGTVLDFTPPSLATASVTWTRTNSRVIVYNETEDNEVYNDISTGTSWTLSYVDGDPGTFSDGDVVKVYHVWYAADGSEASRKTVATAIASATGWSILIGDAICPTYQAYYDTFGTTGEAVWDDGEYTYDGVQVDVDLDPVDASNYFVHRLFQWDKYALWHTGNRQFFSKISSPAPTTINIGDILIENISDPPNHAIQRDIIQIVREDGTYPIRVPSANGGTMDVIWQTAVLQLTTGGISPSEAQIKTWVRSELSTEMTRIDAPVSSRASASDQTAIKAKTDGLTFTVAGQVDVNVQSMNDAEVLGDGTSGDKWRGGV